MDLRNLAQRVAVAVVAIPAILYLILMGGTGFMLLVTGLMLLGTYEMMGLVKHKNHRPHLFASLLVAAAIAPLIFWQRETILWPLSMVFVIVLLVMELFRQPATGNSPLNNAATSFFSVFYVGLLSFLLLIRELPHHTGMPYAEAGTWVLMLFACIWICDTAAYFVGHRWGRTKLFERVSPKKTVEGAVAGVIFALFAAVASYYTFVRGLGLIDCLAVGLIAGTVGQLSDLVESLLKRDAGVKDSSHLIPGHGGILDRFDSQMLAAPIMYFYLYYVAL